MKQFAKTIVIAPLLAAFFIMLNPHVAKTNMAAPPTGGLSGDPSRTSCALIGCHFGSTYTFGPGELTLKMGDTTANLTGMSGQSYIPGQTYYIELKPNLRNGSTPRYGFQMTSLTSGGTMAGAFTVVNAGRNTTESLLNRNYISHKNANSNSDWIFQWTAPSADSGAITFYYAVNMANGDNSTGGDSIYTGTVVLNPSAASGIPAVGSSFESLNIYPDPAKDFIMVSFENITGSEATVSLYTLDGKKIASTGYDVQPSATNTLKYSLPSMLAPGVYLVELEAGNRRSVQRIAIM